jgi:hypothetical protein
MRYLLLSLTAVLVLAVASPASARTETVKFTASAQLTYVSGLTYQGPLKSKQLGNGTVTYDNTLEGNTLNTQFTVDLKFGQLKGTAVGTYTPGTDGNPDHYEGDGVIASGTKQLRGSKGSFHYVGTNVPGTGKVAVDFKGTLKVKIPK